MAKPRVAPLPAIILSTLLVQLATPGVAWADGESPPTEEQPAVEVSNEAAPTIGEILESSPPGTEVMVVDSSGAPQPLVTQQAAEAIVESDPEWCPDGSSPGDGLCTGSFATVSLLLAAIGSGGYSGNGTIYFSTDYTVDDAHISGSDARLALLQRLGIEGQGHSLSVPLEVTGWAYDVSLTNLDMVGAASALRVETTGAIQLSNVNVSESGGDGAVLDNTSGTGSISVTDSTFSDNTWTGLDARSNGDITLTNVAASGQEDGAYLDASGGSGSITVDGGSFSGNTLAGVTAGTASGDITLDNVTADSNTLVPVAPTTPSGPVAPTTIAVGSSEAYGIGLSSEDGGAISVSGGSASQNDGNGLWIEGTGPINLQGVAASENGSHGAYIHNIGACTASPISVTVDGGTFQNNGSYGLLAVLGPNGAFTLGPGTPVFGGNALGDSAVNLDPCPACEKKEEGKPYNIVYVPEIGTPPVPLDCAQYAGTVFIFPGGNRAKLTCPVSGEAAVSPVPGDGLPGPLPAARSFVSGASVALTKDGQPVAVLTEGGYLTIAFAIPKELKGTSLAILYWDPLTSAWVELPAYSTRPDGSPMIHRLHPDATPDDLMYILGGVRVTEDTAKVKVTFGGTFVLVSR
jgi:Right handed beta helix region